MNPKKNLLLLLVFLIIGGAYYVYDVKWAAEEQAAEERKVKLLKGIDEKALIRIDVSREEEPYQIIRTEKGWRFIKPIDAAVDSDEVEKLIDAAAKLRERNRIGSVKDKSEFGMDKPRMKIKFGLKDKDDVSVEIGDRTPTREFRYAALAKTPGIFTLQLSDIDKFDKTVFSIRDRSIVPIIPERAQKVIVEPQDGRGFTVVRKDKNEWTLVKPLQDRADAIDSEGIVSTLKWDKVQKFVEEKPENLSSFGLDKPNLTVRIFTENNQKPEDGIILGNRKVEETLEPKSGKKKPTAYYYARRLSGGPVMLINEKTYKDLPKSAFSLRHKTVIDYDVDHITRLLIESKSQKLDIMRKAKKKWDLLVAKPDGKQGKLLGRHKHIDDLLWDIKWSNSLEYVDEPGDDLSPYALMRKSGKGAPHRYTLWLRKKEDGPLEKKAFIIGEFLKEKQRAYGQIEGEKRLFAIKKEDYDKITKTPYFLSERRLLLYPKDSEITEVTARFPDKSSMKVERFGATWRFVSPEGREAEPNNVNDLVSAIRDFEREGEAKPGEAPDFKDFIVELSGADIRHGKWGPFRFAGREGSEFLFVREGGKVYRMIKKYNEEKLPKSLKDWEKEKQKEDESA